MKKVKDMNGTEIKIGDSVRKHYLLNRESSPYKEGVVQRIAPMHSDGEAMIWAGKGGAHHPLACVVVKAIN